MATIVTFLQLVGLNVIEACLVFYFFFKICIFWPRKYFGEKNLAKKALVDPRFLL